MGTHIIIDNHIGGCGCNDPCDNMGVVNAIIADYDDLVNKPSINDVELTGNKTSTELGLYGNGNEPPYPVTSVNGMTGDVIIKAGGGSGAVDSVNGKVGDVVLTKADIGLSNVDNVRQYSAENEPPYPVTSVNGQKGNVVIDIPEEPTKLSELQNDVGYITNATLGDYAKSSDIPTKTSELKNDSGYITETALDPYAKKSDIPSVPTKTSQLANDSGFITSADVPTKLSELDNDENFITEAALGDYAKTADVLAKSDVTQTLDNSTDKVPSAKAVSDALSSAGNGDMLKAVYDPNSTVADAGGIVDYVNANGGKIDVIKVNNVAQEISDKTVNITVPTDNADLANGAGYITSEQAPVQSVNGQTGAVNITIPDVPTKLSELDNDAGFITDAALTDYAKSSEIPTNNNQLENGAGYITAAEAPVTSVNGQTGDVVIDTTYDLPVANADTLGGVKPQNKTEDMTAPVGVDSDGRLWVASTGGNVTAEQVYFTSDLVMTYQFGKYTPVDGKVTVPANEKNLKQLLLDAYSEDKNPKVTQPTMGINSSTARSYEVGTDVTPKYSGWFNQGAYEYSNTGTGVTATSWSAKNNVTPETTSTQSGEFASYQVVDGANYKMTLTVNYSDGDIPLTALGAEYPAGQIKAGSKSATSGAITGYRNSFYGTFTDASFVATSDTIRTLAQKSGKTLNNGATFTVNVPVGAMGVIIAYPATLRDLTYVKDVNGMSADITSVFTQKKSVVEVSGANSYNPIEYKVFRQDFAQANDTANTYSVQI